MDLKDILVFILILVTVASGIAWAALFASAKGVVQHGKEIKEEWDKAVADGKITDAERILIGAKAIDLIEDAVTLLQFITNLVSSIKELLKGK